MKKIIVYTLVALFCSTTAFSQFKWGVRGGLNVNNINLTESSGSPKITYERGLGFHFGLTSQLNISRLYIQPELLFSTVTHDVTVENVINSGLKEVGKQRFNKMDIPVIAGIKFDNNFKLGAGPVFTKTISSKSDVLVSDNNNKATVGYQLVAGWDWDKFSLEARYEGNLSKYGAGVRIGGSIYDFDQRTNQFILSAGFYF